MNSDYLRISHPIPSSSSIHKTEDPEKLFALFLNFCSSEGEDEHHETASSTFEYSDWSSEPEFKDFSPASSASWTIQSRSSRDDEGPLMKKSVLDPLNTSEIDLASTVHQFLDPTLTLKNVPRQLSDITLMTANQLPILSQQLVGGTPSTENMTEYCISQGLLGERINEVRDEAPPQSSLSAEGFETDYATAGSDDEGSSNPEVNEFKLAGSQKLHLWKQTREPPVVAKKQKPRSLGRWRTNLLIPTISVDSAIKNKKYSINDDALNGASIGISRTRRSSASHSEGGNDFSKQTELTPEKFTPSVEDSCNLPSDFSFLKGSRFQPLVQLKKDPRFSLSKTQGSNDSGLRKNATKPMVVPKDDTEFGSCRILSSQDQSNLERHDRYYSRLNIYELSKILELSEYHIQLTKVVEVNVLEIFKNYCNFNLGYQTWIRDTNREQRVGLLEHLHKFTKTIYPEFDKFKLEVIIRRGSYSLMQSRLRRERRSLS